MDLHKRHSLDFNNGYAVSKSSLKVQYSQFLDKESSPSADENLHREIESILSHSDTLLRYGPHARKSADAATSDKATVEENAKNWLGSRVYSANGSAAVSKTLSISVPIVPAFIAYENVVLTFEAYFKQTLPDGNQVPARPDLASKHYLVRRVLIKYYVEDDSILVVEPPVENSGLAQGVLIKRQLLPKPKEMWSGPNIEYFTLADFDLAINISFYNRTYRIVGCDAFTENFFSNVLKSPLAKPNPAEVVPLDPYVNSRQSLGRSQQPHHGKELSLALERSMKLKNFLENDRKVLRFYCVWDDRSTQFGELRNYVIHYFLVDNCVEVREMKNERAGHSRDPAQILLRRQKLPKSVRHALAQGVMSSGDTASSQDPVLFYSWQDFHCGAVVQILGRPFLIQDCDQFTESFYIQENMRQNVANRSSLKGENQNEAAHAQNTGVDGETHDNGSQPASAVLANEAQQKPTSTNGKLLRFIAKLESQLPEDQERRFVVTIDLRQKSMSIYEPPVRNSGIVGGKFVDRAKFLNPLTRKCFQVEDLFVGSVIEVHNHRFLLTNADDFVFNWMQAHPDEFPQSDVAKIRSKCGNFRSEIVERCLAFKHENDLKAMSQDAFMAIVKQVVSSLNQHEVITVARAYGNEQSGLVDAYRFIDDI